MNGNGKGKEKRGKWATDGIKFSSKSATSYLCDPGTLKKVIYVSMPQFSHL